MTIIDALLAAVFGGWLLLSVINQFRRGAWIQPFKRRDIFGLLPTWTFFAPTPGRYDVHLLIRDLHENGTFSSWKEVETYRRGGKLRLVRPERRISKAVSDARRRLQRDLNQMPEGRPSMIAMTSLPYLLVLHFVMKEPAEPGARQRQFLFAMRPGQGKLRPLFESSLHRISGAVIPAANQGSGPPEPDP